MVTRPQLGVGQPPEAPVLLSLHQGGPDRRPCTEAPHALLLLLSCSEQLVWLQTVLEGDCQKCTWSTEAFHGAVERLALRACVGCGTWCFFPGAASPLEFSLSSLVASAVFRSVVLPGSPGAALSGGGAGPTSSGLPRRQLAGPGQGLSAVPRANRSPRAPDRREPGLSFLVSRAVCPCAVRCMRADDRVGGGISQPIGDAHGAGAYLCVPLTPTGSQAAVPRRP